MRGVSKLECGCDDDKGDNRKLGKRNPVKRKWKFAGVEWGCADQSRQKACT